MAYFANINTQNKVTEVIVVADSDCGGGNFPESEPIGQAFIASLNLTGLWLQTSLDNSFRNCYAGIGYDWLSNIGEYGEFQAPPKPEPLEPSE